MAGQLSRKDELRILNIMKQGFLNPKDFKAVMNLAFIASFDPQAKEICKMFIAHAKEYYPALLDNI